ncbi:phenoxazinone synthase [Streptomyces albofaciens JCM 4342]|uniref:multicopper oxidase family protein n=1 Tax=Streptomyces albofaciens TaxID=66866 RepID=UPI0012386C3B|nr:multicopper oxidase domain-containing protein [Streptomyces albofaciens]KAA6212519.1 phenoxazinone synthase [Streptomyces albofaciens JCM 4342]
MPELIEPPAEAATVTETAPTGPAAPTEPVALAEPAPPATPAAPAEAPPIRQVPQTPPVPQAPAAPAPPPLTPFLDPLRVPPVLRPETDPETGRAELTVRTRPVRIPLHSQLPPSLMWAYEGQVPGPTIEVRRGTRLRVSWANGLSGPYPLIKVETRVPANTMRPGFDHGADTFDRKVAALPPWTVVHLHGARTGGVNDGWTDNAVPPGETQLSEYLNDQAACTLWYHDHAMNITALNVMTGLAGMYWIRDDEEEALGLPDGVHEVPLVLCDRNVDTDWDGRPTGLLMHKVLRDDQDVPRPFFGPYNVVNGVVQPHLEVAARWYRFRMVNGSNARFFTLRLCHEDGTPVDRELVGRAFHQIGTDSGLLPAPEPLPEQGLTLAPGERADVLADFSVLRGLRVHWADAATNPPGPAPSPEVLQFRVADEAVDDPFTLPARLSPSYVRLSHATAPDHEHRWIVLTPPAATGMPMMWEMETVEDASAVEIPSDGIVQVRMPGRPLLTLRRVAETFNDTTTIMAREGGWEQWNVLNLGGPVHPFHIHLIRFQETRRQNYDARGFQRLVNGDGTVRGYGTVTPVTFTGELPVTGADRGWKDTVRVGDTTPAPAGSGQLVSVLGQFDGGSGRYMYHCHILEHEDEAMMRPFTVMPGPVMDMHPGMAGGGHGSGHGSGHGGHAS